MNTYYDESIGQYTNQANKRIMRFLNSKLEAYDITLEQWNVLSKLSQEDNVNQKQLSEKVDKDQPTLTRILDILERKNYVLRQPSKCDKRAFTLKLTDKGLILKNEVGPFIESLFKIIISGISSEEIETYNNVLAKIISNININEKELK